MRNLWCCEPRHLAEYVGILKRWDALDTTELGEAIEAFIPVYNSEQRGIMAATDGIATIDIEGVLRNKRSGVSILFGFGGTTYTEILEAIETVAADPGVHQVVLAINSPGGEVDGLDQVWMALRDLKKPITAINKGMMASAAYWIASAADKIVAETPSAETGSIGVQIVAYDWSKYDEKQGIKEIRIVSTNAPNKNPDPATPDGLAVYQDELDAMERVFISRVAEGRGISAETVAATYGRGGILIALDPDKSRVSALSVGMIDSVVSTDSTAIGTVPTANKKEEKMPLADLLRDDILRTEYEQALEAARAGGRNEVNARLQAALPYLDNEHPKAIRDLAIQVLRGGEDVAALKGAAAVLDALKERDNNAAAIAETNEAGPTPAEKPATQENDGVIRSEEDYREAVAKVRKSQNREDK